MIVGDTFDDTPEVIFLADGDRIINIWNKNIYGDQVGYKYEVVSYGFPFDTFLKIANSKKVEVRIGTQKELVLTETDLEALRDIASRAVP